MLWVFTKGRVYRTAQKRALAACNGRHVTRQRNWCTFSTIYHCLIYYLFTYTIHICIHHTHIYTQTRLVRLVTIEMCSQGGKDYTLKWAEHGSSILRNWLCMNLWENVPHSWLNLYYDWSFYWHSLSSDTSLNFHTGHSLDQLIDFSSVL